MDTFLFAAILSVVFVSDTRLLFCQHKRIKTRFDITLRHIAGFSIYCSL